MRTWVEAEYLLFTCAMSGVFWAVRANYRHTATFLYMQAPRGPTSRQPQERPLVALARLAGGRPPLASSSPNRREFVSRGGQMATPRFLFVAGTRPPTDAWFGWPDRLGLRAEHIGVDGSWFGWRLAAANNRELARSASVFADLDDCRMAVARLRESIDAATPATVVDDATGLRAWHLSIDGELVAVSARRYHRQRECLYSLAHFLDAVRIAQLPSTSPRGARLPAGDPVNPPAGDLAGIGRAGDPVNPPAGDLAGIGGA